MRRRIHLSLRQKALVLIAVPLAFELSLLGTLFYLLNEAEKEAREADRANSVIAATNTAVQGLFDCSIAFLAFDARSFDFFEERMNYHLKRLPQDLRRLRELVHSNPTHTRIVDEVMPEISHSLDWIRMTAAKSKAGARLDIPEALAMRSTLNDIVAKLDTIIKDEKREQRKKPKENAENLKTILKILLLSGIAMSILLALLLVIIFHQSTTQRLQRLMVNSVRLGEGKKLTPILDGNDEIALIDRTFHAAADALEQAALKRAELEKMKKQFVAMISHDLRTPISSVSSTLELLGAGAWGSLNEMGVNKVNMAAGSLRHSIQLINNLLDLEKMEAGLMELDLKTISLQDLLDRSLSAVEALAEKKSIALERSEQELLINGDEFRLLQVLINLLGNAIKFSPLSTKVQVAIESSDSWAKIMVKDQGPGVSAENAKMVFERFHQSPDTKEKAKEGTGLGLAICKAIIEAHGGNIGVENNEGGGSCFWFRLKLSTGDK